MRKLLSILIAVVIVASLVFGSTLIASSATTPGPNVMVASPVVKWDKAAKIQILGYGFTPQKPIYLLITDSTGVKTDFTAYQCVPAPVPNAQGAFATEWTGLGTMINSGLLKSDAQVIEVTDENYATLAAAVIWVLPKEEVKK